MLPCHNLPHEANLYRGRSADMVVVRPLACQALQ